MLLFNRIRKYPRRWWLVFWACTIPITIFALFAMSLGLLVGYAGLVSLGHAAFFGAAAYAVGLVSTRVTPALLITLPAGVAVGTLTALHERAQ